MVVVCGVNHSSCCYLRIMDVWQKTEGSKVCWTIIALLVEIGYRPRSSWSSDFSHILQLTANLLAMASIAALGIPQLNPPTNTGDKDIAINTIHQGGPPTSRQITAANAKAKA